MANKVSRATVEAAVMSIRDRGDEPTYDAIIKELGGGSKRDIGPHLRAVLEDLEKVQTAANVPSAGLEKALEISQELALRIFRVVRTECDERSDTTERVWQEKYSRINDQLEALRIDHNELQNRLANLESELVEKAKQTAAAQDRQARAEAVAQERQTQLQSERQDRKTIQQRLDAMSAEAAELRGRLGTIGVIPNNNDDQPDLFDSHKAES